MNYSVFVCRSALMLAGLSVLANTTGCVTYMNQRATQEREDMLLLQEDMRKLSGRLEGVDLELRRLQSDLDAVRDAQSRSGQAQSQAMQSALDESARRIAALEASRERDKQEIIDRLSSKIADIMKKSAPASATRSKTKRSISDTGYEHVVQSGETLSAIAAAYNVRITDILEANDMKNADLLRVGQKLFIPE